MTTVALEQNHGWTLEDIMAEVDESEARKSQDTEPDDGDDILIRGFRGRDKYVCGICERYHNVGNRQDVEDHIREAH